jgi:hypothetical protein
MRLCVRLVVGLALAELGCQGGYPIAPTACDEWCDATQASFCGNYQPAECVSMCESQGLTQKASCRQRFDAALECYRRQPSAAGQHCAFGQFVPGPCDAESEVFLDCASYTDPPPAPASE